MYDIIIVGGGPAGMTAALYALRSGRSVLIIEKESFGGQITHSPRVENYPGFDSISGSALAEQMMDQVMDQGAEVEIAEVTGIRRQVTSETPAAAVRSEGEETPTEDNRDVPSAWASAVSSQGEETPPAGLEEASSGKAEGPETCRFIVETEEGTSFEARSVILATGVRHRLLGLPGEEDLVGEGVSYCAVCDADFYAGRTVCLVGGGDAALQEAILLSNKCEAVAVIHRRANFTGEQKLQEILLARPNVRTVMSTRIRSLLTDDRGIFRGVELETNEGASAGMIPCDALFVSIGQIPENAAFADLAELDGAGYFASGENCRTATPGVFTAGDCRQKRVRQLTTAVADGAVAALAACDYLNGLG